MFKKIITISLLGVSALALVNANAATASDTVQNTKKNSKHSRANTIKHKNKAVTEQALIEKTDNTAQFQSMSVQPASQVPAGVYVTGQIGYADAMYDKGIINNNGIAGRLALGYKITPNVAMEVGFLQLKNGEIKDRDDTLSSNQYAMDLAGKGILPVTHDVNLYGKVGVAYLTTRLQDNDDNANDIFDVAKHKWAPEVAVGMSYNITPHVNVDTSFTHIHPVGNNRPSNINFLAVGVGYTFG